MDLTIVNTDFVSSSRELHKIQWSRIMKGYGPTLLGLSAFTVIFILLALLTNGNWLVPVSTAIGMFLTLLIYVNGIFAQKRKLRKLVEAALNRYEMGLNECTLRITDSALHYSIYDLHMEIGWVHFNKVENQDRWILLEGNWGFYGIRKDLIPPGMEGELLTFLRERIAPSAALKH